ncbi:class A beta-lactamase [Sphingomonas hankookensis]|nr:class A beta-lactamase [Sphingomonas hankookensis]WCP72616.1 class A beta-lactamase [Sphingomonas hankookensis]
MINRIGSREAALMVAVVALGGAGLATRTLPPTAQAAAPRYAVPVPLPAQTRPAPPALVSAINALGGGFQGKVGIAVRSIDDGWVVGHAMDERMPQQSVSKLWVALTVMNAVDEGRLALTTPVTITRSDLTLFHQPIAYLMKDGVFRTTVGDLLRRALTMSDNTANDKLLNLAGGPVAVRDFIASRGLGNIRFGPGERLLQAKTAGLPWKQEYSQGNAFAQARSRLDPNVRRAAYQAYVSDPPDGAGAGAIADALARLHHGMLLTPQSTSWLLDTMSHTRTGRARIRAALPAGWSVAHKTGTGQDLGGRTAGFNDVGILTAPDGKSYAIAVLIGDTSRPVPERQQLIQTVVSSIVAVHGG